MKQSAMFSLALAAVVATFGVLQADDKQECKGSCPASGQCEKSEGCPMAKGQCPASAGKCCGSASDTATVALAATEEASDKQEQKKAKLQCPMMDKPAKESVSTDYKGAKIYFCCPGCIKAFEASTAKHATKANEQLVASGQAKQKACPLSGKPASDEKAEIDGVVVRFCCGGCKAAVEKAEAEKRREMIFGEKAFDKGFEVKKQEKKEDKA